MLRQVDNLRLSLQILPLTALAQKLLDLIVRNLAFLRHLHISIAAGQAFRNAPSCSLVLGIVRPQITTDVFLSRVVIRWALLFTPARIVKEKRKEAGRGEQVFYRHDNGARIWFTHLSYDAIRSEFLEDSRAIGIV
jgi:hypothetical protein